MNDAELVTDCDAHLRLLSVSPASGRSILSLRLRQAGEDFADRHALNAQPLVPRLVSPHSVYSALGDLEPLRQQGHHPVVTLSPSTSTLLRPAFGCTLMSNSMRCTR